jgi:hypothetical protein
MIVGPPGEWSTRDQLGPRVRTISTSGGTPMLQTALAWGWMDSDLELRKIQLLDLVYKNKT